MVDPSINPQGPRTFLYEWCRLVSIAMDSETFQVLHPNVPIIPPLWYFQVNQLLHANGKYLAEKTNSFFNECLSWSCMFFGCYIFIQSDPKIKSPKTSSKKSLAGDVGFLTPPAPSTQDTFFPHRAPGKGGRSP